MLSLAIDQKSARFCHVIAITEDDYYTKSTEFRIWLREYKDKYFDELNAEQTRRYFKKFVNAWNQFKLESMLSDVWKEIFCKSNFLIRSLFSHREHANNPYVEKYYDGIRSSQVDKSDKTRYKWNIKANTDELEAIKNTVDRQTNKQFAAEAKMVMSKEKKEEGKRIIGTIIDTIIDTIIGDWVAF